jgi:hypothetical protein
LNQVPPEPLYDITAIGNEDNGEAYFSQYNPPVDETVKDSATTPTTEPTMETTPEGYTWMATQVDISGGVKFSIGGDTPALYVGICSVGFSNPDTGESFTAEYYFEVTNVEGIVADLGGAIDFSYMTATFEPDASLSDIAESYEGIFNQFSIDVPIGGPFGIAGSAIYGEEKWVGGGFSISLGFGVGYSVVTTDYSLTNKGITSYRRTKPTQ